FTFDPYSTSVTGGTNFFNGQKVNVTDPTSTANSQSASTSTANSQSASTSTANSQSASTSTANSQSAST
ncbi:hypothetical protein, partial [Staphylococcus warneri]